MYFGLCQSLAQLPELKALDSWVCVFQVLSRPKLRLWRRGGDKLFLDGLFEGGFRQGSAQEDAIDEEPWRPRDAGPHAVLVVLLNLYLVFFSRNAGLELLCVQLELGRFSDQSVMV